MFKKIIKKIKQKKASGSALLLSLLLITSIIVIAMGGSSLALSGIRMAGVQSQSVKAYFAAEAGAEELLYKVRKSKEIDLSSVSNTVVISNKNLDSDSSFFVILHKKASDPDSDENVFISIGTFLNTRRSVDLRF
jgi:glucose-6-phosphate isomerase